MNHIIVYYRPHDISITVPGQTQNGHFHPKGGLPPLPLESLEGRVYTAHAPEDLYRVVEEGKACQWLQQYKKPVSLPDVFF